MPGTKTLRHGNARLVFASDVRATYTPISSPDGFDLPKMNEVCWKVKHLKPINHFTAER